MNQTKLKVGVVPLDIAYADTAANLASAEAALDLLEEGTHLAVLPELFATGFVKNPQKQQLLADSPGHTPTADWLRAQARSRGIALAGSMLAGDGHGRFFNRGFFIGPNGEEAYYDKRHLFTHSGEDTVFAAGNSQSPVVDYLGWKVKLMVCYDLRFPTWCRNVDLEYDLLLFPANWPESREYAFRHLLAARAIENQAAVVGANRGGEDRWGVYPPEMSQVYDFMGRPVGRVGRGGIVHAELDKEAMDEARRMFPVYLDADARRGGD